MIVVAPNHPTPEEIDGPCVFLAGPIIGARDWQSQAANLLVEFNTEVIVANPRRRPG